MKKYVRTDVSEQELEEIVRRNAELIEEGLNYMDHQKPTPGGRLDVLLVDSGHTLVVAELKVLQDEGMLLQGLDYYDYVSTHAESFARNYKSHAIDPTKQVRLLLIAPSFSQSLISKCKWLDLPITLFTYSCLKFQDEDEIVPIFTEQQVPLVPEMVEVKHLEDHLSYITDLGVRKKAEALLNEIKSWKPASVSLDPIKYAISMKVNNRVFAYLLPRRQHFIISTFDKDDEWKEFAVKGDDDLANVKAMVKAAMERQAK